MMQTARIHQVDLPEPADNVYISGCRFVLVLSTQQPTLKEVYGYGVNPSCQINQNKNIIHNSPYSITFRLITW